jgi:hypothetical protein
MNRKEAAPEEGKVVPVPGMEAKAGNFQELWPGQGRKCFREGSIAATPAGLGVMM